MLGHPHLVLANIGNGHEPIASSFRQLTEQSWREDTFARCVIAVAIFLLPGSGFFKPGANGSWFWPEAFHGRDQLASNGNIRMPKFGNFAFVSVKMNDPGVGRETVKPTGGSIVETSADIDQEVALLDREVRRLAAMHTQHTEQLGMRAWQNA